MDGISGIPTAEDIIMRRRAEANQLAAKARIRDASSKEALVAPPEYKTLGDGGNSPNSTLLPETSPSEAIAEARARRLVDFQDASLEQNLRIQDPVENTGIEMLALQPPKPDAGGHIVDQRA